MRFSITSLRPWNEVYANLFLLSHPFLWYVCISGQIIKFIPGKHTFDVHIYILYTLYTYHIHVYTYMYTCICTCMYTIMYICMYMCTYMYVCIHICACVCIYVHTHTHMWLPLWLSGKESTCNAGMWVCSLSEEDNRRRTWQPTHSYYTPG